MSWILGLFGWGGAAAIVAVLVLGVVVSRNVLLIGAAVVALALLAWGGKGYVQAKAAESARAKAVAELDVRTGERDKARRERQDALDAAQTCSDSVRALKDEADAREKAATQERKAAAAKAQHHQQRAAAILAAPPAVPGDDAASAHARIDAWLKERAK